MEAQQCLRTFPIMKEGPKVLHLMLSLALIDAGASFSSRMTMEIRLYESVEGQRNAVEKDTGREVTEPLQESMTQSRPETTWTGY
jgi:hypothetical protein